jgi:hypothetical protein
MYAYAQCPPTHVQYESKNIFVGLAMYSNITFIMGFGFNEFWKATQRNGRLKGFFVAVVVE